MWEGIGASSGGSPAGPSFHDTHGTKGPRVWSGTRRGRGRKRGKGLLPKRPIPVFRGKWLKREFKCMYTIPHVPPHNPYQPHCSHPTPIKPGPSAGNPGELCPSTPYQQKNLSFHLLPVFVHCMVPQAQVGSVGGMWGVRLCGFCAMYQELVTHPSK